MRVIIALFSTVFFWGSAFVYISIALDHYSPKTAALIRITVASIIAIFLYLNIKEKVKVTLIDTLKCTLLGAIGMGVYSLSLNIGEQDLPASVSGFVVGQMPLLASIGAAIFLKEKMSARLKIGVLVSLTGLVIIAFCGKDGFKFSPGLLWLTLTAFCGTIYTVFQKPILKRVPTMQFVCFSIWGAFFALLALFLIRPENVFSQIACAKWTSTLSLIYLGAFPSIFAYIGWTYALSKIDVAKAGLTLYCMPLVGAILAAFILHEIPTTIELVGMVLAFSGSLVGSIKLKRRARHVIYSDSSSEESTNLQEAVEMTV